MPGTPACPEPDPELLRRLVLRTARLERKNAETLARCEAIEAALRDLGDALKGTAGADGDFAEAAAGLLASLDATPLIVLARTHREELAEVRETRTVLDGCQLTAEAVAQLRRDGYEARRAEERAEAAGSLRLIAARAGA